jgi:membrane protein implicated in regulation of membrane protease activity
MISMMNFPINRKPNVLWMVLLLAPFVGVLWVPFFNRVTPEIWGIPFFFWYQFLWVVISAVVTALVYFKATPPLRAIQRKRLEKGRN